MATGVRIKRPEEASEAYRDALAGRDKLTKRQESLTRQCEADKKAQRQLDGKVDQDGFSLDFLP
ncbi:MAG TPA: hypothetical protein VMR52_05945 [Dehalococcoidia bacterium]|nr:hypothetical protein [Dehalococcoidia bacterium]